MRKYKIVLLFLLVVLLVGCLASCNDDESGSIGKVEITTAKSGKIDVTVYSSEQVGKDNKTALTPLVGTTDKSITDDATGMHRIIIRTQGEGTLTTSTDKATEGTTVTFTATPATNWRFVSVTVNGELVLNNGTSFVMPASDANVVATFADMRHVVVLGDHIVAENWGELRDDYYLTTAYTLVEGQRYEFTVDYHEENHYYEDKDVTCRSKEGNDVLATVTKVGDGRYSFVAPDSDCWVTVTTHEYRHIDAVKVFTSSYDWGIYDEQDYTDYFTVAITVDGQPYTYGEWAKDIATVRMTLSSQLAFTVVQMYTESYSVTYEKVGNGNQYTFALDFSTNVLRIKIELSQQPNKINCSQTEHGSISCSKTKAFDGETVTVTATPDEGYKLYLVRYTTDGENYTGVEESGGVYSFTMPDSEVTIKATFVSENAIACSVSAVEYHGGSVDLANAVTSLQVSGESYTVTNGLILFFEESQIGNQIEIIIYPNNAFYGAQYVNQEGTFYGEIGYYEWGNGSISLYVYIMDEDFGIVLKV